MKREVSLRLSSILPFIALSIAVPALAEDRRFEVGAFDAVVLTGVAGVVVEAGTPPSVIASGDQSELDRLDIRTESGSLLIGQKRGQWGGRSGRVTVRVTAPALRAATISGAGNLDVARPVNGDFAARISGSGDLSMPQLSAAALTLAIAGSGTMRATGTCQSASISVSGSGDIEAAGLRCSSASVMVSGSGNVTTAATDTAEIRISGSGNVAVAGTAKCTSRTSGSGTVRCG